MSEITTYSPAIVSVSGKSSVERKLSAVSQGTYASAMALCSEKGKVGKVAQLGMAKAGLGKLAGECARGNYKGLAAYIATILGEDFVISGRSTFESLPDQFEQRIMAAKRGKNGGYTTSKKTGLSAPNAKLSAAMRLKGECVEIIAHTASVVESEKAKREALTA